MKNLLQVLLVLPLMFSCGGSLDKELTSKMLEDGYTGQGTYTSADGDKWVGEWKDGKAHGQGTLTYAKGEKYLGEWMNGMMHGQGTYTNAKGEKYVGEWMNGMMHGQGTYTNAKGEKYVGEYMDAKMNGQGTYTSADGTIEKGLWQNDVFVGQSSKIIGTPIKIGNLEVAQNDFPKTMNWNDANSACEGLGNGWRLPTKDELNLMFVQQRKIGGFANKIYWSTEYNDSKAQYFCNGTTYTNSKTYKITVRAVRSF